MSQFMKDSDHRWMRDCDVCTGWHYCAAPDDVGAAKDWTCETCAAISKRFRALKAERDAAVADNAVVVDLLKQAPQGWHPLGGDELCALCDVMSQPHPGAALLEERTRDKEAIKALADALREAMAENDAGMARWYDDAVVALRLAGVLS